MFCMVFTYDLAHMHRLLRLSSASGQSSVQASPHPDERRTVCRQAVSGPAPDCHGHALTEVCLRRLLGNGARLITGNQLVS